MCGLQRKRKAVDFATSTFKQAVLGSNDKTDCRDLARLTPPIGAVVGMEHSDGLPGFAKLVRLEADSDGLFLALRQSDATAATEPVYIADASKVLRRSIPKEIVWPLNYELVGGDYVVRTTLAAVKEALGTQSD